VIQTTTLMTLLTQSQPTKSYGLLWWLQRPFGAADTEAYQLFAAFGYGGQTLSVYPAKHLIAIRTKDPDSLKEDQISVQEFPEFRNLVSKWE
jgi:CubicO group peptidase (beta-lactamase class C family)